MKSLTSSFSNNRASLKLLVVNLFVGELHCPYERLEPDTSQNFCKPAANVIQNAKKSSLVVSDTLPVQEIIKSDYPASPEPSQMGLLPEVNKS